MAKGDASAVVKLQSAIKFNGGGHVNHSIFWDNLAPVSHGGGEPPHSSLGWAIDQNFGSMDALVAKVNAEGAGLQGSGWVPHANLGLSFKLGALLGWAAFKGSLDPAIVLPLCLKYFGHLSMIQYMHISQVSNFLTFANPKALVYSRLA